MTHKEILFLSPTQGIMQHTNKSQETHKFSSSCGRALLHDRECSVAGMPSLAQTDIDKADGSSQIVIPTTSLPHPH